MNKLKKDKTEKYHTDHDLFDRLSDSYENMYEHITENLHHAEEKTEALFNKLVSDAKNKVVELKHLSEEDAEKVATWVRRDITDAGDYLSKTGNELKDWFGFETALVENKLLDMLIKAADQTTIKLLNLKEKSSMNTRYRSGEVIGPATLKCEHCGEVLQYFRAGVIPICPKCHETHFYRIVK